MKHKLATLLICMSIGLTGCSNKTFNAAVEQGNEALANKDYSKAEASFRLALLEKNDDLIFKLNEQTNKIISILDYIENKEYDKALDECKEIEKDGFSNDLIKNDVTNIKKDIEKGKKLDSDVVNQESKTVEINNTKDDNKYNKEKQIKQTPSDAQDDIDLARATIYQCRELSYKEVDVQYQPPSSLGTAISDDIKNTYYIFLVEDLADGTIRDTYIIVDKTYFTVNDMDMYGNIQ